MQTARYSMLTGKAVQRAFRGLLLVDLAMSAMIVSDEFNVKAPCIAPAQDIIPLHFPIKLYMKQKRHVPRILARQHRQTLKQKMHKLHEIHPEVSRHFDQRQLYTLQCLEKLPWLAMTRICLCFCIFMSRTLLVKSSSNQRSGPEQRRVHDAGTSSMHKVCWDVQFATIILLCCFLMPSSAVIQLLGYSAGEKDSL